MPLANMVKLLGRAQRGGYAVPAFDVVNTEYASAIVGGAQRERSPVIIMVLLVPALLTIAGRASVPVAVHLDHAADWDTVVRAVKLGCESVMLDRSGEPYDENVARTREVVRLCRPVGASVESEIGSVRGDEAIGRTGLVSSEVDERYFTDPEQAGQFVKDTEVDALAVSVGNTHGLYRGEPHLDLDRIEKIASRTDVPLVLHGGTGLSDRDFRGAVERGMCKINVNTALVLAAGQRLKRLFDEDPDACNYPELLLLAHQTVADEAARFMRVFGSSDKASCGNCQADRPD